MFSKTNRFLSICCLLLFFVGFSNELSATHNRAGEITYRQIDDLTIEVTITTYTKGSSIAADRDSLELCWGDGVCMFVLRNNGPIVDGFRKGEALGNDTKKNLYIATHIYPAIARYTISMTDPNRNGGVINVNPPNSDLVQFHLETTVTFLNAQFQGFNNSPRLLQPPIDFGCVGKRFIHNANAYDEDGDSLTYEFIVPLQDVNVPVPNYSFPTEFNTQNANLKNELTLDPLSGDLVWDSPQIPGEYNIALIVIEYREGVPLDTMIRDMQIFIEICDNEPPEIETVEEICVIAGETIDVDVIATDPDVPIQKVRLSALGGPFEQDLSPAEFIVAQGFQDQPLVGNFRWETTCEHISKQPYTVVFKATDNFFDTTGLVFLKTVRITVVGPPPEGVTIQNGQTEISLSWDKPYTCEAALDDFFLGFSIYRRNNSNQFLVDECEPGLDGKGYERLVFNTTEMDNGRYVFTDMDIEKGRSYCYRILAVFAKRSQGGNPFNIIESLPSEEVCLQIGRDIPIITNVSIDQTDATNGAININWSKPLSPELDTVLFPGPYVYELQRADKGSSNYSTIATLTKPTFATANDTTYFDEGLDTATKGYEYRVNFYVNGQSSPFGSTEEASSIFLSVSPTERANILSWSVDVPWQNTNYVIFRKNNSTGLFEIIGDAIETTYRDGNLENGTEYCYFVKSEGSYSLPNIIDPLINESQEACGIPVDDLAPCATLASVVNNCGSASDITDQSELFNTLSWRNPNNYCDLTDDVGSYNIYFSPLENSDFTLLASVNVITDTIYIDNRLSQLAGCYYVTSLDMLGNESEASNVVCIENCPIYSLPNAFTPNSDGQNDIFKPINFRYIDHIEMEVFNRWGTKVFETTDPEINWNGNDLNDKEVPASAYFYTCKIFETRLTGIEELSDVQSGYIQIIK